MFTRARYPEPKFVFHGEELLAPHATHKLEDHPLSVVFTYKKGEWHHTYKYRPINIRETFEQVVDWGQCAAVMQREAVTVTPKSCGGGGNVVVA
jgi:hypothetical protein